jgi:hypothetical protein
MSQQTVLELESEDLSDVGDEADGIRRGRATADDVPLGRSSDGDHLPPRAHFYKAALDWTALQRALVFTKLGYRKPSVEARRVPARRSVASLEKLDVTAVTASVSAAAGATTLRQYEIIDGVDERLLPWSLD